MTRDEFQTAKGFIHADITREIQLARIGQRFDTNDQAAKSALAELGLQGGGGNWLAALGLLCYTEFGGRLKFGHKNDDGDYAARKNFDAFFQDLGNGYRAFLNDCPKAYHLLRCGLAHEYFAKEPLSVAMLEGPVMLADITAPGVAVHPTNPDAWVFCVERYFRDLMAAFNRLEKELWP